MIRTNGISGNSPVQRHLSPSPELSHCTDEQLKRLSAFLNHDCHGSRTQKIEDLPRTIQELAEEIPRHYKAHAVAPFVTALNKLQTKEPKLERCEQLLAYFIDRAIKTKETASECYEILKKLNMQVPYCLAQRCMDLQVEASFFATVLKDAIPLLSDCRDFYHLRHKLMPFIIDHYSPEDLQNFFLKKVSEECDVLILLKNGQYEEVGYALNALKGDVYDFEKMGELIGERGRFGKNPLLDIECMIKGIVDSDKKKGVLNGLFNHFLDKNLLLAIAIMKLHKETENYFHLMDVAKQFLKIESFPDALPSLAQIRTLDKIPPSKFFEIMLHSLNLALKANQLDAIRSTLDELKDSATDSFKLRIVALYLEYDHPVEAAIQAKEIKDKEYREGAYINLGVYYLKHSLKQSELPKLAEEIRPLLKTE
jgi:hypothetical protein